MAQIKSVAALGGVEVEIVADYKHFEDNKKPDFLAKFPHGKIPALEGLNGFNLTEGVAIARYCASILPLNHRSFDMIGKDENYSCINSQCRFAMHTLAQANTILSRKPLAKC